MAGNTPLLNAEIEALAKIIAHQPHALELREYFDICFREERSQVIFNEMKQRKAVSVTKLIQARS